MSIALRLALNVSYEVQPTDNQRFFRWLSVFPYGTDFSPFVAARLLLEENDLEVEERLRQLVDSSLLLLSYEGAQGTVRFRLHTLLHDCGREKLQAAGEWDMARKQYVAVYMQQTRAWQELLGKGMPGLEREWQVEAPNVTQALVHARDLGWWNDVARLVEHVASIARMSGQFGFLNEWLGRLESHSDQIHELVRGIVVKMQVESAITMRQWDEIIANGSAVVDDEAIDAKSRGSVWLGMALAYQSLGDTFAASRSWQRGWQCAEESRDPYLLAGACRLEGDLMLLQGRPADSLRKYSKAEKAYLGLERNQEDLIYLYAQMGEAYSDTNEMSLALQFFRQAMDKSLALGWPMLIFKVGQRLVVLEMMMGNLKEAKGIVTKLDQALPKFVDIEPFRSEQVGLFLRSKSSIEHYEGNYRKAAELAEKALIHLQAGGVNADTLVFTWCMLGENRLEMEDYTGALQATRRARIMYEQAEDQEGTWKATELIEEAQQGISGLGDK